MEEAFDDVGARELSLHIGDEAILEITDYMSKLKVLISGLYDAVDHIVVHVGRLQSAEHIEDGMKSLVPLSRTITVTH